MDNNDSLMVLMEQARSTTGQPPPPRQCPPCSEDAPPWLRDVRDQYVSTGFVELGAIRNSLAVGQKLVGPRCEYLKTPTGALALGPLPFNEKRAWHVE